jgi:hypothetical protein
VAFQSEIELRVKVIDKELQDLEKRIEKVTNPFGASGARKNKGVAAQKAVLNVEKNRLKLQTDLTGQAIKQLNISNSWGKALQKAQGIRAAYAKDAEKAAKFAQKEQKAVERTAALNKRQRGKRFEGAALGAGFPLLFGGGIGQSAAGLAGSLLGPSLGLGQMGGGIAAQAGVAAITQAVQAIGDSAAVTESVGAAYDFLTENALFASEETQALADELAELGRVEELAKVVTQELVDKIGNEGVQNLKELDGEFKEFLTKISELGLAVAAFLSKYLIPVINTLNNAIGGVNQSNRFNALTQENPEAKAFYDSILGEKNKRGRTVDGGLTPAEARAKTLEKFPAVVQPESLIEVTKSDTERFTPPKGSAGKGKTPYDPTKRIADLTAEAALIKKIAEQDRQINYAQVARQDLTVIELKLNKELERIEAKRLDMIRNSKAPDAEKAAINALAAAKAQAAQTKAADEAFKFLVRNAESTALQVEQMGLQTQLADALTREEQKQLKLQIGLLRLREANKTKSVEQLAALEKGFRKLFAAQNLSPLESYIRGLQISLSDTEGQIVKTAQALEGTFASSLSSAITGVVAGTKTAEEAFSEMFANIGKAFIDMATQMIAKALVMKALGILTGGSGGGGGGGGGMFSSVAEIGGGSMVNPFSFAGGGYTGNAPRTGGMDGRGGFPAMLHPQETVIDHTQARGQYSPGNALTVGAMAPMTANVTYNGPTLNFNGDDYIPRSEAPALVAAGAKQGQARAMNTLKNSRSQRAKLGM